MTEFELIERYLQRPTRRALLGNGDDAAVVAPSHGMAFVLTTDTLIEGRHFLPGLDAEKLGRRVVAVNLSDLAAMAALPRYAMLSLVLPEADEAWLAAFAHGLWAMLDAYDIELIGGNTTRGALAVSLTAMGEVPLRAGQPVTLRRSAAQPGDELWVSGPLGDAGWACLSLLGQIPFSARPEQIERYELPQPRVALGLALRDIARAAIDVSDGLLSEAGHLARASRVAIEIEFEQIPTGLRLELADPTMRAAARHCLLASGDAYELLFTAPPGARAVVERLLAEQGLSGACIGRVLHLAEGQRPTVYLRESDGSRHESEGRGWDHFA